MKTSTFVIGLGVAFGVAVLWAMKKEEAVSPQPQPSPVPGGTSPGAAMPPGPYDSYVPRPSYTGPASYNPNPMFQYYPQVKT